MFLCSKEKEKVKKKKKKKWYLFASKTIFLGSIRCFARQRNCRQVETWLFIDIVLKKRTLSSVRSIELCSCYNDFSNRREKECVILLRVANKSSRRINSIYIYIYLSKNPFVAREDRKAVEARFVTVSLSPERISKSREGRRDDKGELFSCAWRGIEKR